MPLTNSTATPPEPALSQPGRTLESGVRPGGLSLAFELLRDRGWLVLLVVAACLRLYGLDREGYWGDEYLQVRSYPLPLHLTIWHALSRNGFGPPDFVIGWLFYRIDPSVWVCRLPSALWGASAVVFLYVVVRRLDKPTTGLMAAALLCFCRMHIALSQEVRPYAICLAAMILTLWMLQRYFDQPNTRNLLIYACTAVFMTTTRSFIPCVFLFSIGVAGSALVAWQWRYRPQDDAAFKPLLRAWMATIVSGVIAGGWVFLMLSTAPKLPVGITKILDKNATVANPYGFDTTYFVQFERVADTLVRGPIQQYGLIVMLFSLTGVGFLIHRFGKMNRSSQLVWLSMLLVGPLVAAIYAAIGGTHKFYPRYSFFLMPVAASLAALGCVGAIDALSRRLQSAGSTMMAFALVAVIFLAYPVAYGAEELHTYRRIDWRGAAQVLRPLAGSDAIVMTLSDKPFGLPQRTFFAKHEWPKGERPLGESVWTYATSDSHFERMMARGGVCIPTVAYDPRAQQLHDFKNRGLQSAPNGYELRKVRDLDLLIPVTRVSALDESASAASAPGKPATTGPSAIIAACDALLSIKLDAPTSRISPLTLKARVLQHVGDHDGAQRALREATSLVPPARMDAYTSATSFADPLRAVSPS
ncbi:MAG: glycosyltransferase family 39 protein [Phycisphaerae bacterium]